MKKILLVLLLSLTLSACSSDSEEISSEVKSNTEQTEISVDETVQREEKVMSDILFEVDSPEHGGTGRVTITEDQVIFEDLDIELAPSLVVYLADESGSISSGVALGSIIGNEDYIAYDISEGVDVEDYSVLNIWCDAYNVEISRFTYQK